MSDAKLTFLGSEAGPAHRLRSSPQELIRHAPWPFLVVVVLPTLLAAFYFTVIASPRYVSEAKFVVRSHSQQAPNSLGIALQGVGLSTSQTDAFSVHQYIESRQAISDLQSNMKLREVLSAPGADPLFRFPRFAEGKTNEDLYEAFKRFLTVGYDSTNGISTLRVEAFRPEDAQRMANGLLDGGEALINRLNERSSAQAVIDAELRVEDAEQRLAQMQTTLTDFRNREGIIDPVRTASEGGEMIGGLMATLAQLRAERAQLAAASPQSPQLPEIGNRIRAYEQQIAEERSKLAGNATSLAPKIGTYERLSLDQELAARAVTSARTALDSARLEARRQQLYLERVVSPSLPDKATEPKRLLSVLAVLLTTLLAYGVGWLIWAGVREHHQS